MMLLCGTVPDKNLPVTYGQVRQDDDYLYAGEQRFSRTQGTGAMISAALAITNYFKIDAPYALVAGDIGGGEGTRDMYKYLIEHIVELSPDQVTLHYSLPIMALLKKLCETIKGCSKRPFMIADAGAMYAAKGAGLSSEFDIFTPDPSEIAFLADPQATHPAYISNYLFASDAEKIPEQIAAAFANKSAAKLLLVKGKTDYVAADGQILSTINEPNVPMLEPIGGTGDTITGLVSALVYAGLEPKDAAVYACRTNRVAGKMLQPTPATKVKEVIEQFPAVAKENYCSWAGICYTDTAK
ncbi:MAG: sugar kinase [Dehalococcoidia bacterium]|nr:sugar kinase [Dehalococcoidia bacterium]